MNPYKVLGVSEDATEDEIKKAYRSLSRKYHPDSNINNPNKELAEERFKQVQEAYKLIMDMRERGETYGYGTSYGTGQSRQQYNSTGDGGSTASAMQAACDYINSGHYREALLLLSVMQERNALWYYYSAVANAGIGNNVAALRDARTAHSMEPDNLQYASLLSRLQAGSGWYTQMGGDFGRNSMSGGSFCCELLALNLFCNFCC